MDGAVAAAGACALTPIETAAGTVTTVLRKVLRPVVRGFVDFMRATSFRILLPPVFDLGEL